MTNEERNSVIEECCAAICGGCRQGIPRRFGRHQTLPASASGGSYPCVAYTLKKLKVTEAEG